MLHKLLLRQITRSGLSQSSPPADAAQWGAFLERVSLAYTQADQDRYTIERSMTLSSLEMRGLHDRLARERDQLDALMRSLDEGVCAFDAEGRITLINDAAVRLLGLDEHSAVGSPVCEAVVVDADSPPGCALAIVSSPGGAARWIRGGASPPRCDGRIVRPDGSVRCVSCSIARVSAGKGVTGGVITLHDITERKQAEGVIRESERRLAESELRFRTLVEGADVIMWEYCFESACFTYVSPQAARLGYPLEAWRKPGFWPEILHPDDRDGAVAFCLSQSEAGVSHRLQYRMIAADGSVVWIDDFVAPSEKRPEGLRLRGVFIDITDRIQREQELESAKVAAEQASRAKTNFLANMSHEIRTPMTAILGYADILADGGMDEGDRAAAMEVIRRNGEHLLEVINDILDISRIEQDRVEIEPVECAPAEIIDDVITLMRVRADAKGIELDTRIAPETPGLIVSDPMRLRQILINLVGNAIKFTDHGSVRVEAGGRAAQAGRELVVSVTDTGVGMTEEQISRVFKPFAQADTSAARRFGGAGLGLAISRSLARMLGGDIGARSEAGVGTVMTLTLATGDAGLRAAPAHAPPPAVRGAPDGPLRARILLAEDGPDNQRLISVILRKAGAEVVLAADGAEAVDRVERAAEQGRPYDLILMDMQMPVMDGYAAATRLRDTACPTPIIAITAHAMRGDRERCLAAGCHDYTTKPIDRAELLAVCRRNLCAPVQRRAAG